MVCRDNGDGAAFVVSHNSFFCGCIFCSALSLNNKGHPSIARQALAALFRLCVVSLRESTFMPANKYLLLPWSVKDPR
jgi:hypothetical protein